MLAQNVSNRRLRIIRVILWAAVLVGMAVIFWFSAQTANESKAVSGQTIRLIASLVMPDFASMTVAQQAKLVAAWQGTARKAAHALAYFSLGLFCMSVMLQYALKMRLRVALALALTTGYAITDEIHQLFVDGRAFQISDILIDAGGALAGALLVLAVHYWRRGRVAG